MFEAVMAAYVVLTLAAIRLTYLEQMRSGVDSPLFRVIGFLLCAAWPLTLLFFASAHVARRV